MYILKYNRFHNTRTTPSLTRGGGGVSEADPIGGYAGIPEEVRGPTDHTITSSGISDHAPCWAMVGALPGIGPRPILVESSHWSVWSIILRWGFIPGSNSSCASMCWPEAANWLHCWASPKHHASESIPRSCSAALTNACADLDSRTEGSKSQNLQ
jgi:hypothetical protein